jgi:hypothetical protein
MITLVLNTGMRVSELCSLSWSDIRIGKTEAVMIVREARKGYERWVPLNQKAREAFMSLGYQNKAGTHELVFFSETGPVTRGKIEIAIARYSELAKLRNVTPAVLHATFCRNLAKAGVGPDVLAKLVGHRNNVAKVLCYYEHSPQDLKQAVARLSDDLDVLSDSGETISSYFWNADGNPIVSPLSDKTPTFLSTDNGEAICRVPQTSGEGVEDVSRMRKVAESKRKTKTRNQDRATTE